MGLEFLVVLASRKITGEVQTEFRQWLSWAKKVLEGVLRALHSCGNGTGGIRAEQLRGGGEAGCELSKGPSSEGQAVETNKKGDAEMKQPCWFMEQRVMEQRV